MKKHSGNVGGNFIFAAVQYSFVQAKTAQRFLQSSEFWNAQCIQWKCKLQFSQTTNCHFTEIDSFWLPRKGKTLNLNTGIIHLIN